ncbi:MAG: glycosyltransferase family 1 protein [Myxococcales bacterium]|nr:glycosyltransferase family 1 protein [Myxococcales bacterium]
MPADERKIRTLLLYQDFRPGIGSFYQTHLRRLQGAGYAVEGFCITVDPPAGRFSYPELDKLWRRGNRRLMQLYAVLEKKASEVDVIVLYHGANLHPEFLERLRTFNVYMCFDDPESSDYISKPVAKHFDACFVANIASLDQYRSWGCQNVFFRPFGFFASHVDLRLGPEQIRSNERDIGACIFCEREAPWRRERLAFLDQHVPELYGRGRGWPLGYVSDKEVLEAYRRARIGINLHNSTGPINFRTYTLPANGLMQICDNKYFLGQIFDLGREVIGYSEIEEVPDLVQFYLANDEARIRIATAGYERVHHDYNEVSVWQRQMRQIAGLL